MRKRNALLVVAAATAVSPVAGALASTQTVYAAETPEVKQTAPTKEVAGPKVDEVKKQVDEAKETKEQTQAAYEEAIPAVEEQQQVVDQFSEPVNAAKEEFEAAKQIYDQALADYEAKLAADKQAAQDAETAQANFETAQQKLETLQQEYDALLEEVGKVSDEDQKALEEEIDALGAQVKDLEDQIVQTTGQIEELNAAKEETESKLQETKITLARLLTASDTALANYEAAKAKVEMLEAGPTEEDKVAADNALAEKEEAQAQLAEEQQNLDTITAQKAQAESDVAALEESIQQKDAEIEGLQAEADEANAALETAKAEQTVKQAELDEANQNLSDAKAKEAELAEQIEAKEAEIAQAQEAVDQAQATYDGTKIGADNAIPNAQKEYEAALAEYNKGSAGFFKYLADQGVEGAQDAYNIVTAQDTNQQDGIKKKTDYSSYTKLGDANDATNLENMKKAIDNLNLVNEYRKKYNETEGGNLSDLKVSHSLMAAAQRNLNFSKGEIAHSQAYNIGENIAWGYSNPFKGWYDKEKQAYDNYIAQGLSYYEIVAQHRSEVGHYLNIVDLNGNEYSACGYAYTPQSDREIPGYRNIWGQTFSTNWDYRFNKGSMTISEYQKEFDSYYSLVNWRIERTSKALEAAKNNQEKYKQLLATLEQEVKDAQAYLDALNEQKTSLDNNKNTVTASISGLENTAAEKGAAVESAKANTAAKQAEADSKAAAVTQKKAEKDALLDQKAAKENTIATLNQNIADSNQKKAQLNQLIADKQAEAEEAQKKLEAFSPANIALAIQERDSHLSSYNLLQPEIEKYSAKKDSLADEINQADLKLSELQSLVDEATANTTATKSQHAAAAANLETIKANQAALGKTAEKLSDAILDVEDANTAVAAALAAQETTKQNLKDSSDALAAVTPEYEQRKQALEALEQQLAAETAKLEELKAQLKKLEAAKLQATDVYEKLLAEYNALLKAPEKTEKIKAQEHTATFVAKKKDASATPATGTSSALAVFASLALISCAGIAGLSRRKH